MPLGCPQTAQPPREVVFLQERELESGGEGGSFLRPPPCSGVPAGRSLQPLPRTSGLGFRLAEAAKIFSETCRYPKASQGRAGTFRLPFGAPVRRQGG